MKHLKFFHLFESNNGDILPISFTWGYSDPCTFSGIYYPETSEFVAIDILSDRNNCLPSAINFFENIRGKRNTIKIVQDPNDEETEISFLEDNSVITARDFHLGNPYEFSHHIMGVIKNEHPEIWSEILKKIPGAKIGHGMMGVIKKGYPDLWQEVLKDVDPEGAGVSADLGEIGF